MKLLGNGIKDARIGSENILIEMTLKEYYELSKEILKNNEYQRKRIGTSNTVYSLLKEDLRKGCLIPPIVLAYPNIIEGDNFIKELEDNKSKILILDGLQRSYTIRDLFQENENTESFQNNKLRVEVYIGINRIGVLYRMLTLNTGQSKMSTRHQIEIIYMDYLTDKINNEISLIKDVDNIIPKEIGEYKYRDAIEGFTSFLERDYLTLGRTDILESIKNLENLVTPQHDKLFEEFISVYTNFIKKLNSLNPGTFEIDEEELKSTPFGNNVISIFNKSQSLTGFGCALGKLIDLDDTIHSINDLNVIIKSIIMEENALSTLLKNLDYVRNHAKKIGNDQRLFFFSFFKALFDYQNDGYCSIEKASEEALRQYQRITM